MKRQLKPTVDLNWFDNYAVNGLITQNTESGEPEIKNNWGVIPR